MKISTFLLQIPTGDWNLIFDGRINASNPQWVKTILRSLLYTDETNNISLYGI